MPIIFAGLVSKELNTPKPKFNTNALNFLMKKRWPGYVRELENYIKRTIMFCDKEVISTEDLGLETPGSEDPECFAPYSLLSGDGIVNDKTTKEMTVDNFIRAYVTSLLKRTSANVSQSADLSRLSRHAL